MTILRTLVLAALPALPCPARPTDVLLMIGTPTADAWVHGHYMQSVLRAADHLRQHGVELHYRQTCGHDLAMNRNRLVYESLHIGADFLLQIDSDIGFMADTPWRLLQWRKDMICIPYLSRHDDVLQPNFDVDCTDAVEVQADPPLLSVRSCGGGFLMTSRAWAEAMWGRWPNSVFQFVPDPNKPGDHAEGEDTSACVRWRSLGGTLFCDPTPPLTHWGEWAWQASMLEIADGATPNLPPPHPANWVAVDDLEHP
jgi:hypothetical protein